MILMFLLDLVELGNVLDLLDRQVNLAHHQDGLQLHQPAGDGERVGPESTSRERSPLPPSPSESQLIPIPISDGDDDQPPQEER